MNGTHPGAVTGSPGLDHRETISQTRTSVGKAHANLNSCTLVPPLPHANHDQAALGPFHEAHDRPHIVRIYSTYKLTISADPSMEGDDVSQPGQLYQTRIRRYVGILHLTQAHLVTSSQHCLDPIPSWPLKGSKRVRPQQGVEDREPHNSGFVFTFPQSPGSGAPPRRLCIHTNIHICEVCAFST